jgi:hypothetical protein
MWAGRPARIVALLTLSASVILTTGCRVIPPPTAGFWYADGALTLPRNAAARLGGALDQREMDAIKDLSRAEVQRAFGGLRVAITDERDAFWRVAVLPSLRAGARPRNALPRSGVSIPLGVLGGGGAVGFDVVAAEAIRFAPSDASRQNIIEGIARGIGRVAVHEFSHQILGVAGVHNLDDQDSYEYPSPERASQYYGVLHWTLAWPLLEKQLGY